MTVETKYNPEQKVWVMTNNKPFEATIRYVVVRANENGTYITYTFSNIGEEKYQTDIFPSKQELLNSL